MCKGKIGTRLGDEEGEGWMLWETPGFGFWHGWGPLPGKGQGKDPVELSSMKNMRETSPTQITLSYSDHSRSSQLSRRIQSKLDFMGLRVQWDSLLSEMLAIVLRKLYFISFILVYQNDQGAHDSPLCNTSLLWFYYCLILLISIWLHNYALILLCLDVRL